MAPRLTRRGPYLVFSQMSTLENSFDLPLGTIGWVRILCEWLRTRDWKEVFDECLPGRRLGDRPVMSKRQRRTQRALERSQGAGASPADAGCSDGNDGFAATPPFAS
eukprot:s198_g40.t3